MDYNEKSKLEAQLTRWKVDAESGDKEALNKLFLFSLGAVNEKYLATEKSKQDANKETAGRKRRKFDLILFVANLLAHDDFDMNWDDMIKVLPTEAEENGIKGVARTIVANATKNRAVITSIAKTLQK